MKFHLVSGACGFVGRNMVRRLLNVTKDKIFMVDDLSVGIHPAEWIEDYKARKVRDIEVIGEDQRLYYPSSSAAYLISLQTGQKAVALKESDIDFRGNLGTPDMTYGWSKLTGEFLAQIAARYYGIPEVYIRPFSGYGEDQDLSYPVPAIAARAAARENPFEVWGTGKQDRDFVH